MIREITHRKLFNKGWFEQMEARVLLMQEITYHKLFSNKLGQ